MRVQHSPATVTPSDSIAGLPAHRAITYPSTTHLIIPGLLLDELLPTLNTYEQVLLVRLYRLSYGFRRNITDHVGKKTLADKCNMSVAMVKTVLRSLEGRGLIEKIPDRSNDPTRGNKYRVLARLLNDSVVSELCDNKAQSPDNLPSQPSKSSYSLSKSSLFIMPQSNRALIRHPIASVWLLSHAWRNISSTSSQNSCDLSP